MLRLLPRHVNSGVRSVFRPPIPVAPIPASDKPSPLQITVEIGILRLSRVGRQFRQNGACCGIPELETSSFPNSRPNIGVQASRFYCTILSFDKCSLFTKETYASPWSIGEWGPWTFQFIADSGVEFNEIGRPAASFDYVQVKAKPFGPDSLVFSMTSKFIGNITTNLLVPAPELTRMPIVNHETLSVAGDIFEFLASGATDTLWLPLAWRQLKPIYILSSNNACQTTTLVCQATDSLSGVAGNHCHPAARGKLITLSSNAAHGWYSYP